MNTSSASPWSVLCSACCAASSPVVAATKIATTANLKCGRCALKISLGSSFAFTGGSGGWRKRKSNGSASPAPQAPSMMQPSAWSNPAPVQAPIVPAVAPAPTPAPAPVQAAAPATTDLDLLVTIARKVARETVAGEVSTLESKIAAVEAKASNLPQVTYVSAWTPNAENGPAAPVSLGTVHKGFARLVTLARAALREGTHLVIWGGAGWGKTHHVRLLPAALGLTDDALRIQGSISDCTLDLTGYNDATGKYVPTEFYHSCKAAKSPGSVAIHGFDELDASVDATAPLKINAILSSNLSPFPNGSFVRAGRLLVVGMTNTSLDGATAAYSGRIRFDRAFKNRFTLFQWDEDLALETALFPETAPRVQALRAACRDRGIEVDGCVTMRESAKIRGLLAEGLSFSEAEEIVMVGAIGRDNYLSVR